MALNHHQVTERWIAQNTGKPGRWTASAGFNIWFDGETIYSYGRHFPIASFATLPSGGKIVLFNESGYSISTAKHKSIVSSLLFRAGYAAININDPTSRDWKALASECGHKATALLARAKRRRNQWLRESDERDARQYAGLATMFEREAAKERQAGLAMSA